MGDYLLGPLPCGHFLLRWLPYGCLDSIQRGWLLYEIRQALHNRLKFIPFLFKVLEASVNLIEALFGFLKGGFKCLKQ